MADGELMVSLPDFSPWAVDRASTVPQALNRASYLLAMTVADLIRDGRPVPEPSHVTTDSPAVRLNQMEATKLALYRAYLQSGLSRNEFARLAMFEGMEIYRLFDLRQVTSVARFERAAAALGKRLIISVVDAE